MASMTIPLKSGPDEAASGWSWGRLWQPRRGVFWLMLAFNALSSLMTWALRSDMLSTAGMVVVTVLALGNCLAGMWLAVRLLRGE